MNDLMDKDTLNKLHKTEQEILDEFVRICDKNNLQYFLIGGTLLGAVRHEGFIPWDDDLDVGMPRKDYDKFLKIAKIELKSEFMIDNIDTNHKYYLAFTKIRKRNTIFEEDSQKKYDGPKGIWIDILPLDEAKNMNSKLIFFQKKIGEIIVRLVLYKSGIIEGRYKNLKKFIGKLVFISNKRMIKIIDKLYSLRNSKDDNKCIVGLASGYKGKRGINEKIDYFPAKKLLFEGGEYSVPNNYDKVLKNVFGDYMELPPVEQRITHNPIKIEFE